MKSEKCRRSKIKNQQNLLSVSEKNVIRDCSYQKSLVKRRNQPEQKLSVTFFETWKKDQGIHQLLQKWSEVGTEKKIISPFFSYLYFQLF